MIEMKKSGHKLDYVVQIINYVYFVSREAVYDLHFPILRFRIPPPLALRDCYIPDELHDVICCVHSCYPKFAGTTYDLEILIVLQFYLLQKMRIIYR